MEFKILIWKKNSYKFSLITIRITFSHATLH